MIDNLDDILTDYINSKRSLSVRTKQEYLNDINLLLKFLDIDSFRTITYEHIEGFLSSKEHSPSMANRRLSAFNSFFKYLLKRKLVDSNPVPLVERTKMEDILPKVLNKTELGKIREHYSNLITRTIVELFYNTGIRFSELCGCDIGDIDFDNLELKVMGKGGRERFVPISFSIVPLLTEYIGWRKGRVKENEQALFITPNRGGRISKSWLSNLMNKLRDRSRIFKFRAHVLRHTFATDAINLGAKRESVQLMLGHRKPSTTDMYIHIKPDVKEDHKKAFP